jgi:two-component system sensor histidine kinase KdpD
VTAFLGALLAERHPEAELVSTVDSPVMVEPRGLERVIGNLLDNARQHAAGTQTTVSASTAKGMLEIEVADRGPGVHPDQLERIFERFATADPARGTGTGLGLAIAAQHAARMGGAVAASLRPGGGLAMAVRLPVGNLLHGGDDGAISPGHIGSETTPQGGSR